MRLIWGADLRLWPSWCMSTIHDPRNKWLATGSLLAAWWRMQVSGSETILYLPDLDVTHLCLCLSAYRPLPVPYRWGACMQPASSPWYLLNPCSEQAWLCFRLDPFTGKLSLSLFSLSLAIPQFVLLCHVSSLRLFSGHSGLVLTLSMQLMPSCSAPARWWQVWASGLLLHWELWLSTYSVCVCVCFSPSQLCSPLRFQNSPQTRWWEGFLVFGNFSFMTPFLGRIPILSSFVSLFVFYVLSYLLLKRIGCLSGFLVFPASIQKLFCGSCSAFKWSFDEFVGETVVSPSCSSAIFRRWKSTPHTSLSCYSVYCAYWLAANKNSMKIVEKQNDFTVE